MEVGAQAQAEAEQARARGAWRREGLSAEPEKKDRTRAPMEKKSPWLITPPKKGRQAGTGGISIDSDVVNNEIAPS